MTRQALIPPDEMEAARYLEIAEHYNSRLREHGDTARGADWPNQADRELRFGVMLDLFASDTAAEIELLDFACGSGDMLRFIEERRIPRIRYVGADISAEALALARAKFPSGRFTEIDIVGAEEAALQVLAADYCVINGLFTVKTNLGDDAMWAFMTHVVGRPWRVTRKGIAFNVMSKHVDYERPDLFHVPFDGLAAFLHGLAGRSIAFRADYGLCEYTAYAYKEPRRLSVTEALVRQDSPPRAAASLAP